MTRPRPAQRAETTVLAEAFNLDGKRMRIADSAANGVVSSDTELVLEQVGMIFSGRYRGGAVVDGYLIGTIIDENGGQVAFRYVQAESSGRLDSGVSRGCIERMPDGRLRLIEDFEWITREGSGRNVFEEIEAVD